MFGWFSGKSLNLSYDIHSHLLPGLDDGVRTFEEAIEILKFFESKGVRKVITTPHIYADIYPNTERVIVERLKILNQKLIETGLNVEVRAAAEYFIDENFRKRVKAGDKLLCWNEDHILIETSFYNKPLFFDEVIFDLKAKGYVPVLAHPERYHYLEKDFDWLKTQVGKGVRLQVNLPSLAGAYGKIPRMIAKKLLKESLVTFLGSDIHRPSQLRILEKAYNERVPKGEVQNWA